MSPKTDRKASTPQAPARGAGAVRKPPARGAGAAGAIPADLPSALAALEGLATKKTLDGMARYGLPTERALGVTVADIQKVANGLGRSHTLAAKLWQNGLFEARMLAAYVDDPQEISAAQMERWARDFDNWGICDTVCFVLFDRSPHAWKMVEAWAGRPEEYVKRAAFALLWGLTRHDKEAADARFLRGLELIEAGAQDQRHMVKKAVNMALRATGKRNEALRQAAAVVARRLASSTSPTPRWVGKDALRELAPKPQV
ncbi:MAG: DNA alkylation repair protein, partial [Thermoanaerobaculia bacterium]